jgi:hypothetical protein
MYSDLPRIPVSITIYTTKLLATIILRVYSLRDSLLGFHEVRTYLVKAI